MASNFLENLKKAVDNGEFNSEAAKKINDIDKLADEKVGNAKQLIQKRLDEVGIKTVTEEDVEVLNSEYEEKMKRIKRIDEANVCLVDLINREERIISEIRKMIEVANNAKKDYAVEFEANDPVFMDLLAKVNQINKEFNNSIFNNLNK
jgi:hypothetical protein